MLKNIIFSLLILSSSLTLAQKKTQRPNIIVILSDDAGYADYQRYGNKEIPTPNINSLSDEGVLFTQGYVSASVCAPSRAGLLTGRYQQRFGFENNPTGKPRPGYTKTDMGLDLNQKTIADRLKEVGYATLAVGKWHLGNEDKFFPLKRGFDEFFGFRDGHRDFFPYPKKPNRNHALWDNEKIVPESEITYLTDMFTDRAIQFVQKNAKTEKPFFIYLAYNAVHTPLQAKDEDLDEFVGAESEGRQTYDAMLSNMDKNIGRLLKSLKDNEVDENTLIIFVNDNGGATNNFSDNGELRGMKGSLWEGGIRVGYAMRWKGKITPKSTYHNAVSSFDVMATCLAAAQNHNPSAFALDGVNLLPYVQGKKGNPHKYLFWKRGAAAAVQSKNWKLIRVDTNPVLLFNLQEDVSEKNNLAEKYPRKVKKLLRALEKWEKQLPPARWDGYYGPKNTIMKHKMSTIGREMERLYP